MVYLHEDREQFLQALRLTYKQTRQMMQIIEKDYYVTITLKALAEKTKFLLLFSKAGLHSVNVIR